MLFVCGEVATLASRKHSFISRVGHCVCSFSLFVSFRKCALTRSESCVRSSVPTLEKMTISDRTIGNALHTAVTCGLIYYLAWMLLTPFVDHDHAFQQLFPPKEYGVVVPALLLLTLVTGLLTVAAVALRMEPDDPVDWENRRKP